MIALANPGMLWASPLVLVPLLLRLLRTPPQPPVVPFPAARLLEPRPMRVRQRLLLAVRMLLLAATVVGFARPVWVAQPAAARPVVFLGESPQLSEAQLGARLAGVVTGEVSVVAGPYFHPALAVFDEPGHGDLRSVRAWRWWKLQPLGRTVVMARFSNGDPFLIESDGAIACALPAQVGWSTLPVQLNFVPLRAELERYARRSGVGQPRRQVAAGLFVIALALGVAEVWLGGLSAWKFAALGLLGLLAVHPVFRFGTGTVITIVDGTRSVQLRGGAPRLPGAVRLGGEQTALGEALLALTNRRPAAVVLYSDGQHNRGVSPAWAAARLGVPVFAVAVGVAGAPRDVSIVRLEAPELVFGEALVRARLEASGYEDAVLSVSVVHAGQVLLASNVTAGEVELRIPVRGSGRYELRVAELPGEATGENNGREFFLTVLERPVRVFIERAAADWEYRHVRAVLRREAMVELVEERARADVVVRADGRTWRLRRYGGEVFEDYWRMRVRGGIETAGQASVSEEVYALGRNDELLQEVARVSGGAFYTPETVGGLRAAVRQAARRRWDARDSWAVLGVLAAFWISSWVARRFF
jgi:hypothetical protein